MENRKKIMTKAELDEIFKSRNFYDTIKIENCKITDMNLSDYELHNPILKNVVLKNVVFRNVEFYYTIISNWNVKNVTFIGCTVDKTTIENSSFKDCVFIRNSFTNGSIKNSDFFCCDINNSNVPTTDFEKVLIINSTIVATNFIKSGFYNSFIKGTQISSCCFFRAHFNNTNTDEIPTSSNAGLSLACPEVGSFIGYKKVRISKDGYTSDDIEYGIAKLMITEDARRSSATSLKCRCNKAKVLEILDFKGNKLSINKGYSVYDYTFEYEVGKMVSVDNFNEDRWKECATGIHFFTSFRDAVEYVI